MMRIVAAVTGIALAVGVATPAHAMKVALKFGATYADFGGDDALILAPAHEPSIRLMGGLVFSPLGKSGLELTYVQKGAQVDAGGGAIDYYRVDYAQATFLKRLGGRNARLVVGGYAAFKLGKFQIVTEGGGSPGVDESWDPWIKDLDFGAVAGLSFGGRQATLDIRYEMGLASIDDSVSPLDIKHEVITVGVTIRF